MSQIEDKLSHDERLRLECLAQSVVSYGSHVRQASTADIVGRATAFKTFVQDPGYKVTNVPE